MRKYLPGIDRSISPSKMPWFTALFSICEFTASVVYLIVNLGPQLGFELGNIPAAQIIQAFYLPWLFLIFVPGWWKLSSVPALHSCPEG